MNEASEEQLTSFYRDVGSRVKRSRVNANLTQLNLSARSGLTRSSIANLEAGRQRVQVHVLALIADVIGVPISDLLPETLTGSGQQGLNPSFNDDLERFSETALSFVEAGLRAGQSNSGKSA